MSNKKNSTTPPVPPPLTSQAPPPQDPPIEESGANSAKPANATPQQAAEVRSEKVKIVKSAIGLFNIVDKVGTNIQVTPELKKKMIAAGVAEAV